MTDQYKELLEQNRIDRVNVEIRGMNEEALTDYMKHSEIARVNFIPIPKAAICRSFLLTAIRWLREAISGLM